MYFGCQGHDIREIRVYHCLPSKLLPYIPRSACCNITKHLHDVFFPKKELVIKYDILSLFVNEFTVHSWSAPYKWGIMKLRNDYAHVIHGHAEHNQ